MEEEVDPILAKLNGQQPPAKDQEVDPILQKLNAGLKKKDEPVLSSPSSSASTEPVKPSSKSLEKPAPTVKETGFIAAMKDMVSSADEPATEEKQDPLVNAVKRGLNLAEQAKIIGPFADKPDTKKIKELSTLQKDVKKLPASKSYNKFTQAKTFGDALSSFVEDPAKIIVELTAESLASMASYGAPRIGAGALLGGAAGSVVPGIGTVSGASGGAVVGMADTSYGLEFTGKFLESLQEAGVDTSDELSLAKAFQDDAIMDKARNAANKKAIPIALFDLVSGGLAGKIVAKPASSIVKKIGAGAAELGIQAVFDAGGEFTGQVASGEDIKPGSILAEAVSGVATSPVEIALGTVNQVREQVNKVDPKSIDNAAEVIEKAINETPTPVKQEPATQEPVKENEVQKIIDEQESKGTTTESNGSSASGTPVQQTSNSEGLKSSSQGAEEQRSSTENTKPEINDTAQQNPPSEQQKVDDNGLAEQPAVGEEQPKPKTEDAPNASNTQETGSVALDQPEEQKLSGIKKALVSQDKVDATPIERRSTEDMLNKAKQKVDAGEINPKSIVDEIANGNARALQPDEVAGLVYYKTQLDNKSDQLNAELISAIEAKDADAQAALRSQIDTVSKEIDNYHTMSLKTAYEQSLAFRMRQMLLDNEYNLQSQINKYRAANNGIISPEVETKFKELDSQLKTANAKIRQLESEREKVSSSEDLQAVRQDAQRQKERRAKMAQQRKEKINEFFNSLKVKSDPNKLNSITQVVGEAVYNGSIEAIKTAVLAGADVASAIQAGVDYVKEHYRGTDFDENAFALSVRPGLETLIPSDDIAKPEMRNGKLHIPESAIRSMVEGGVKDINELVDQLHEMVVKILPDVSKREVRDAITKYGETRSLSKDEINTKIREMKRVGKLLSALEDVQNKIRPLRSGLQRDKLTDQERKMQKEIKEAMKDLPVDQAELDKEWKNALDQVKARLRNQITDLENQISTGEKTAKKKGIKYDDEANALKEQRDKLKSIIEATEGKPRMSDEQKVRMATTAVEKSIADLEKKIKDKDTSAKEKSTSPITPELAALRKQRDDLRKAYLQMEKDMGVADAKKLAAFKKAIKRSTDRYEERIKNQDFVNEKKKPLALDDEANKLKLERDKIKQQFDIEQEKARLKNRPLSEKIWDTTMDVWNLPKSFLASIDMSAPFRQGAILSVANPKAGVASFAEMFRQAFSENKANEWLLKLRESPEYAVMKQSKLYLAEPNNKLTAKEEQFLSNLAGKIPVIGKLVSGSERAYTGYLNKLRVDIFANGADRLREQGITPENNPEAYKSWANFINNATGRGNLGGMEMAAPVLNGLFFSPRYVASRVNLLNPVTYAKMPASVRKMAMKNMIAYVGFGAIVLTLFSAGGADVELDPRSSDFGKIKIGDTRYDIWAGFQQLVRLIAQLTTGQRKSTKTGEITELSKDKFPYETRADVALRFGRSKLSPTASTVANVLAGETIMGEEVTIQGEVVKNVVPLYLQDIKGIYEEEGPTGVTTSMIPAFFGIGVQSYGEKSGLTNSAIDEGDAIKNLNKERKYSISQPSKSELTESLDHEVDDVLYDQFHELRDKEIKRLFDRYKGRLEAEKDIQIYDKLMDQIVREAGRHAKYKISREKGWRETAESFDPGNPFRLKNYKKNNEGKVVAR